MEALKLSRLQAVIGLLAGISSLGGAVYSGVSYLTAPAVGEVAALVREAGTQRPVRDATLEILTPEDALITTLAPAADGWTRFALQEGSYRVRVTHSRLGGETRPVEILGGQTTEVRFSLASRREAQAARAARGGRGGGPVTRFLSRLGL